VRARTCGLSPIIIIIVVVVIIIAVVAHTNRSVGRSSQSCPSIDFDCSEARKSHGGHNFVCLRDKCACESTCDGLGFVACGPGHCGGVCGACPSGK
jgi:hypothetical protein